MNLEYNIKVFKDGNMWCALLGSNLQEGIAGFGGSAAWAIEDLAQNLECRRLEYDE